MSEFLHKKFPGLKLQSPLFYNWPIGLRFEIGPVKTGLWKDSNRETINEEYFTEALNRAVSIFEAVFCENDDVELVYQQYSDGRMKIRKTNFIFRQIEATKAGAAINSDVRDIYELDHKSECWKRLTIPSLSLSDIDYKNILLAVIHTDFGSRKPSVKGECFFINTTKNSILHLYDDRGMDVISSDKETLVPLYALHNDWLLDYDRKKMESVFS